MAVSRASRRPVMLGARTSMQRRHKPDYLLVLIIVLLMAIGLVLIYAISPGIAVQRDVPESYYITKQLTAIGIGVIAFIIAAAVPMSFLKNNARMLLIGALGLTALALVMPVTAEYPAHRWVRAGGVSLQSVEVLKLGIIFTAASFLVSRVRAGSLDSTSKTLKPLLIAFGAIGIVVAWLQSDLGSAGVIVAMLAAMAFVAGLPIKRLLPVVAIVVFGTLLAVSTSDYRRERFLSFLQPERDCQTAGYQACQALITVGSGGIAGKGIARGVQAYGYLPEASNDSIFAIHAEKFGFIGSAMLVVLFGVLFARMTAIVERAPDLFSRLVVVGILAWLSTQTIINIGAMVGLLPLKGITLPFVSYGGTSMMFVLAAMGVVFNISRYTTYAAHEELNNGALDEDTAFGRGQRRTHYAAARRSARA